MIKGDFFPLKSKKIFPIFTLNKIYETISGRFLGGETVADDLLVQNKCQACGGQLDDSNAKYCPHCGILVDKIQEIMNRKNQTADTCPNCGSSIMFIIEKQQFECEHCKSNFSTQKELEARSHFYQADKVIPFQVEEERAKMHFYEWLATNEIQIDIASITLKQLYMPFSVVTINYRCNWGAEIYYSTNQDNAVENWSYSDGSLSGECFSFFCISEEMNSQADKLFSISSFKPLMLKMVPYDDHYLTGTNQFKISGDEVMKTQSLFKSVAQYAAEDEMKKILPGDRNKNAMITNLNYEPFSEFVYVPIWNLKYQSNEVIYDVLMTATDKEKVKVVGDTPAKNDFPDEELSRINKKYKKKYRLSMAAILISVALIITYDQNNIPSFFFSIITVSLFIGGIGSWLFFGIKSKLVKRAYLKSKKNRSKDLNIRNEYLKLAEKYKK